MMKNDILQSGEKLIRVLALSESKAFVIDCKKQTMPYWTEKESLSEFKSISEAEMQEILGCRFPDADELCGDEKRQMREAYRLNKHILAPAMEKMRGKTLSIAFIWLADAPQPTGKVQKSMVNLLTRLSEKEGRERTDEKAGGNVP